MTDVGAPMAGAVLSDRYRLEEEIGRGGAGLVFRAHDERLDRQVAVKVLTDLGDPAVARFRREAATAARIHHPNVVTLHDAGLDGETPYLVMSLVEGPSLADRVEADGPLDHDDLHRLATDLFAGLDATHEAGVLHRDLTPRNILFDRADTALLADFGIARGADDPTVTAAHTVMGTRPFVAPERLRGEDATRASDVFAIGVTLRYAATGSHAGPMPDGHPFASLVLACTSPDPADRPTSARAAADHLDGLAAPAPRTEAPSPDAADTVMIDRRDLEPVPEVVRAAPRPRTVVQAGDVARRDLGRPAFLVGLLAALVLAGVVGSATMRNDTPPDAAPSGSVSESAVTEDTTAPSPADRSAPAFDPAAPGESARRLATWLRERDEG